MDRPSHLLCCVLCYVLLTSSLAAHAQEALGARASVERPLAARNEEDATASATTVEVQGRPMALETLRDVMLEVPAALSLASGGYGSFSSVSLRGSDLGQTVWVLGDVPLNSPDTGAFDMSLLPVSMVDRIEVYRGGAPLWLGQGSIGGVVRVVPREEDGTGGGAQLGIGSYGLYELRGHGYVSNHGKRPIALYSGIQATSSRGNFPYLDDNGSRSNPSDDVERRIRNAQIQDGAGLFHLRVGLGRGHLDSVFYGFERTGGAPGAAGASKNARHTRRQLRRGLLTTAYTLERTRARQRVYRLQLLASAQAEDRQFDDRYAELGLGGPRALTQIFWRGYGRAAASYLILPFLEVTGTASYAGDRFEDEDKRRPTPAGPSTRATEALAAELRVFGRVFGVRSELRGSARGEWSQSELQTLRISRASQEKQALFSGVYRLSAVVEPTAGLSVRSAIGTGRRIPSMVELFGDGGALRPNPDLVPEQGRYVDAGFVLSGAVDDLCASLEANGFLQHVDHKISYVSTNQFESEAINFGRADVRGVELGADAAYRRVLRLVGATTVMQTEADNARQLPRQPKLKLYGRAESSVFPRGAVDRLTFFGTVDHVSTAYFDKANQALRTPFTHVGLGAALAFWHERLEVSARVADLLDARGQDYLHFPLPGRFFALSVSIREERL